MSKQPLVAFACSNSYRLMSRTVLNIDLNQIEWVRNALDCSANEALRLLQLYGYLEHITSGGNAVKFTQSRYATKTGFSRETVKKDLQQMAQRRWAEVITTHEGTEINLWPIPFEGAQPLDMPSEQARVASSVVNPLPSEQATDKKVLRTLSSKEEEGGGSKLKQELIQTWNEHKPSTWPALKAISAPRDKTVRKLGGYRAVIDLLPDAMRGAKASKFWNAKGFTWENFMGDKIPKGHIQSLAESAPTSSSSNSPRSVEHPDFFPPTDAWSELHPKHNRFTDDADRDRREAEAREFYKQQEA